MPHTPTGFISWSDWAANHPLTPGPSFIPAAPPVNEIIAEAQKPPAVKKKELTAEEKQELQSILRIAERRYGQYRMGTSPEDCLSFVEYVTGFYSLDEEYVQQYQQTGELK